MSLYFIGKPRYKLTCCTYSSMPSYFSLSGILKSNMISDKVQKEKNNMIKFMEDRKYIYKLNHSPSTRKLVNGEIIIVVSLNISFDKLADYSNLKIRWTPKHIDWS